MLEGGLIPVRQYAFLSTHILAGIGDLVEIVNTGVIDVKDDPTSSPEEMLGAIVALYDTNKVPITTNYLLASVAGYADIALAVSNAIFRVQCNGTPAATDLFESADTDTVSDCNTVTGRSTMELSGTTDIGAANWLIIDKVDEPGNDWDLANVDLLVIPCESYFVGTTSVVRVGI